MPPLVPLARSDKKNSRDTRLTPLKSCWAHGSSPSPPLTTSSVVPHVALTLSGGEPGCLVDDPFLSDMAALKRWALLQPAIMLYNGRDDICRSPSDHARTADQPEEEKIRS